MASRCRCSPCSLTSAGRRPSAPVNIARKVRINAFTLPSGVAGRLAGHLMVLANAPMQRAGIDLLELRGNERVIELGFGPGVAVRLLSERLPAGSVCGVDPSDVMLQQARRRNRVAIAERRADLRLGLASRLDWPDAFFDAALSLNNVALWEPLDRGLEEVHRVLKPGGRLGLGEHEWAARGQGSTLEALAAQVPAALATAGFSSVQIHHRRHVIGVALYLTARA